MARIPHSSDNDPDQWPQTFRAVTLEYWMNRKAKIDPRQFITELADDLCELDSKQRGLVGLVMEALGGPWKRSLPVAVNAFGDTVWRSPKWLMYDMVATRFDYLGRFEAVEFNGGDCCIRQVSDH